MLAPTDETAKLLAALESVRSASYQAFSDRRDYEWKFCVALWTVFIIYVSALVVGPVEAGKAFGVTGWPLFLGTVGGSLLMFWAHLKWTIGISVANSVNLQMAEQMTESMRDLLQFQWTQSIQDCHRKIREMRSKGQHWRHWSHSVELFITLLLGVMATCAAWIRGNLNA